VDGLAGNFVHIGKDFAQRALNAAKKLGAFRADVILRRAQLQGEQSSRRQMFAGGAKELGSVEAVQLRGLRVGQIENDHVKLVARGLEIKAAVGVMEMNARILSETDGGKRSGLGGEELPRHVDDHGIELHIVDALDRRMLQDVNDTAVRAATDEKNLFRRRMLQQRVMDRFFGGSFVGHTSQDHAVVVDTTYTARLDDGQVAINRVTGLQQVKSPPQARLRRLGPHRRNIDKKRDRHT